MISEWRFVTRPPTIAERWAGRILRGGRQGRVPPTIWPNFWPLAFIGLNLVIAWAKGEWVLLTIDGCVIVSGAVLLWERHGFRLLLDRYDDELEHLRSAKDLGPDSRTGNRI